MRWNRTLGTYIIHTPKYKNWVGSFQRILPVFLNLCNVQLHFCFKSHSMLTVRIFEYEDHHNSQIQGTSNSRYRVFRKEVAQNKHSRWSQIKKIEKFKHSIHIFIYLYFSFSIKLPRYPTLTGILRYQGIIHLPYCRYWGDLRFVNWIKWKIIGY